MDSLEQGQADVQVQEQNQVQEQEKKIAKTVAYERFKEVIDQKNALKAQIESLNSLLKGVTEELNPQAKVPEKVSPDEAISQLRQEIESVRIGYAIKDNMRTYEHTAKELGCIDTKALFLYMPNEVSDKISKGMDVTESEFSEAIQSLAKDKQYLFKAQEQPKQVVRVQNTVTKETEQADSSLRAREMLMKHLR